MPFPLKLFLFLSSMLGVACTHVSAWDRGKLAHPTMTQPLGSTAEEHVNAIHEGATGGGAAGGGGCGCN